MAGGSGIAITREAAGATSGVMCLPEVSQERNDRVRIQALAPASHHAVS